MTRSEHTLVAQGADSPPGPPKLSVGSQPPAEAPADIVDATTPVRHRQIIYSLLALATPIIAANISRTVMSFVDFIMVSQLGIEGQAAIIPAGLFLWTLIGFGMGLMTAVNTFVSQSLGRRRHADCAAYGWQVIYIGGAMGLLAAPTWFAIEPMFRLAGHGPAVLPMEVAYARIGLLGTAPTVAAFGLAYFFTGIHRPMVGFFTAVISNAFNIVANYALIFGHWGMPKMGIAGAAWATVAAVVLQMALLLMWMLRPYYARQFATWRMWRPQWRLIMDLLRVGSPTAIQFCIDIGAWALFTIYIIGRFGEVHLAANNICIKMLEISFMPAIGIGHAITATAGKAIGHGRVDLARRYFHWGAAFCVGYMGLVGIVLVVLRVPLADLLTDDPQVIRWASYIFILMAIFQVFDALSIACGGVLRGAGDTVWPAVVWAICNSVVLLGGGALMAWRMPQWGSVGLWGVATVHISILGCLLLLRYLYGPWARIDLFRKRR